MGTFYNTPELNSVALNGSIEYIFGFTDVFNDDFYTWLTPLEKEQIMYYGAFESCVNLSEVLFVEGEELLTIGDKAFYRCTALKSIKLPERTLSLGENCFDGSGLSDIDFGGVRTIAANAFGNTRVGDGNRQIRLPQLCNFRNQIRSEGDGEGRNAF